MPKAWDRAWLENTMAHHVGFCAVWLMTKIPFALAFYYYEPVMVLPNLFMSILNMLASLVAICE